MLLDRLLARRSALRGARGAVRDGGEMPRRVVKALTLPELAEALAGSRPGDLAAMPRRLAWGVPGYYACLRVLSGGVAAASWRVVDAPVNTARSLQWLFDVAPAPRWNGAQMKERIALDMLERGNAYVVVRREGSRIRALEPVSPGDVRVLESGDYAIDKAKQTVLRHDMLHFSGLGYDGREGRSAYPSASAPAGALRHTQSYLSHLMSRGALSSVVVTISDNVDAEISDDGLERLSKQWEEKYGGVGKSSVPIVLKPGMQLEKINLTPEQAQLKELNEFQITEIARAFGVPSSLVNLESKNSSLASGVGELIAGFLKFGLSPILNRIETEINRKLCRVDGWRVEIDTSKLTRLTPKERYESYEVAIRAGVLTPGEARAMEGLD